MFTRTNIIRFIKFSIIGVIFAIILAYALFRSLNYARGPSIEIFEPPEGSGIASGTVQMIGRAERIKDISMNGFQIIIDEQGNFRQDVIIFKGVNLITFLAHDQFGRSLEKQITLVGA